MYASGEPGGFDAVVDTDNREALLTFFVEDTSYETVTKCLAAVQEYAENQFNDENIEAKSAGGAIGVAGAFNDSIRFWFLFATFVGAFASFFVVVIFFRSITAGIFLIVSEIVSIVIWLAALSLAGIEMNSNACSSAAIIMGIGVDAEIYYLYRFKETFKMTKDFKQSLVSGLV